VPGDLVFMIFGAVPLSIVAIKAYLGLRKTQPSSPSIPHGPTHGAGSD